MILLGALLAALIQAFYSQALQADPCTRSGHPSPSPLRRASHLGWIIGRGLIELHTIKVESQASPIRCTSLVLKNKVALMVRSKQNQLYIPYMGSRIHQPTGPVRYGVILPQVYNIHSGVLLS